MILITDISPERKGTGGESIYGPTFEGNVTEFVLHKCVGTWCMLKVVKVSMKWKLCLFSPYSDIKRKGQKCRPGPNFVGQIARA